MKRFWLCLAVLTLQVSIAAAGEIGFAEDFALARNREETLKKLIPGTEDYYYYHCLHYLNTEQFEKVEAMTRPWLERFGQTGRLTEIQTRYALLSYEKNPQRTLDYLRNHLGLRFDQQRIVSNATPNLATSLDQNLISRARLQAMSFARWQNLDNFENSALDWLAAEPLNWERRRNLLQRLQRPDVANLPSLVVQDLLGDHAVPFGTWPIHRQMTLAQLDELLKLKGDLLNQEAFVRTYLVKLHPGDDEDYRHDPALMRAYLDRLLTFVRRLSASHNSLKAHVLYQRLVLDRSEGTYDKDLFIEYLKLPRFQPYMAKAMLESVELQRQPADLNANYTDITTLPIVGPDEALVRDYLKHFFVTSNSPKEFEPYINDVYLRHLFAETKIENGLGDPETWASQLPPELFRQLKDRIDIDFAPINKTSFGADEPVKLDLFVKNVPTLIVKVFEINTQNYYRTHQQELNTDINLDGLVARTEQTVTYTDSPFRRMPRSFQFPQLAKPGVYVVDFIGNGKSSRALIRKGRLRPIVETSTAGQRVTVVDDGNHVVKDAALWLGGHEYKADENGRILIPFSTNPGRRSIVLSQGDFACLDSIDHKGESYELRAGIHVDREALLTHRIASLIVRPGLYLNGQPISIKLLEDVRLRIVATDLDGIATSTEIPEFKLFEDRESIHEFRVPPRLARLNVTVTAKVKSLSENKSIDLAANQPFALNEIAKTDKIEDLLLAKFGREYVIDLLGRTGEVMPDRPVQLAIKHRDFREPVQVALKSDTAGRIHLGPLADILQVTAIGPESTSHTWNLLRDLHTYRDIIDAKSGETVSVPYLGSAAAASRDEMALFEMRGETNESDRFDALSIKDGMIDIRGLAAGDYDLWLKRSDERIRIRIVDGVIVDKYVLGALRELELSALKPVQISSIEADNDQVTVRLRDFSPYTRVHVFATRYDPAYPAFNDLSRVREGALHGRIPAHTESVYISGRNIGDEYRYVLDRRNQRKFPGNMLNRPELLLNPWVLRSTETGEQMAEGGENFQRSRPTEAAMGINRGPGKSTMERQGLEPGSFSDLDFLADASVVILNLVPDKDGVVRVSRKEIGAHSIIHVVAVDPVNTTARWLTLPEHPARKLDLRLRAGLDPKGHFTQQKKISVLPPDKQFVVADAAGSRFEVYDSLAKVYTLYATLSNDAKLAEFAFILNWPNLKPAEKRTQYSKFASHELNFFLSKKDPEFFRSVIRPYLANKKDKTFMDRWLLEEDLSEFTKPWQYDRLNVAERALLAQRLAGEHSRTARDIQDLLRLQPPNFDRTRMLYETAIKGSALAAKDALKRELLNAADNLGQLRQDAQQIPPAPASPESMPQMKAPMGGAKGGAAARAPAADEKAKDGRREAASKKSDEVRDQPRRLENDKEAPYFDNDRAKSALPPQLYRKVEVTKEWAEDNYYHLPIEQQLAALVPVSDFWLDYARYDSKGPFLSGNLADASRDFTEMMLALSVLDLPFTAGKQEVKFDGNRMSFTPTTTVVAFHEEIHPVQDGAGNLQILVSQNFYREGDRYREENGERFDKFVTNEFVVHTVYGCQLVITNATPSRQRLSVLIQVPVGSIPVANGQDTKTVPLDLEPYHTQTIDYLFYFPKAGRFGQLPVQVAKNESLVAAAAPFTFEVVEKPTKLDTESWAYVSQNGTNEQVLAFMNRENVHALNLDMIAFRMRDKEFFQSVIQLLNERHDYNSTLWSYGVYHNIIPGAREFLMHADSIVAECGGPIVSPLLVVDPVARYAYQHLEYKPLVNARAHSLGKRRQIVNDRLDEQYHRFLHLLGYRPQLNDDDRLAATYYLLLQDRVDEAMEMFAEVNRDRIATKMQYDYCAAYLDFYGDEPQKARSIAVRYVDHPVDRWRDVFRTIVNQLDEIEGKGLQIANNEDRTQRQTQLASQEPSIELTVNSKAVNLTWQNVESARLNFYLMDVELLFSRNPFVQQSGDQFASIRPNFTREIKLPTKGKTLSVKLPDDLARRNVLVEVSAGGKTYSAPYYSNAMDVKLNENYGQVHVTDSTTGKPLAKVYVKTYARLANGQVKFYKDGYTDHRGRFDYASVSTPEQSPVVRFAILVLSDEHGATIRETNPPQQ
jgi:5-hydroxyisourate hydrolase-like protein (transthyretin family)